MDSAATQTTGRHLDLTNPWIISLQLPVIQPNIVRRNTIVGECMIALMTLLTVGPVRLCSCSRSSAEHVISAKALHSMLRSLSRKLPQGAKLVCHEPRHC